MDAARRRRDQITDLLRGEASGGYAERDYKDLSAAIARPDHRRLVDLYAERLDRDASRLDDAERNTVGPARRRLTPYDLGTDISRPFAQSETGAWQLFTITIRAPRFLSKATPPRETRVQDQRSVTVKPATRVSALQATLLAKTTPHWFLVGLRYRNRQTPGAPCVNAGGTAVGRVWSHVDDLVFALNSC